MPLITTVSLTVISVLTIASSNALVNLFQAESPTSPVPPTLPETRTSAESDSPRSSEDSPEEEEEPQYGLWTVSELRPSHPRAHSRSYTLLPSGPTHRAQTAEEEDLPSYELALISPPKLGRKALRICLEGEAPPEYEDVVGSRPPVRR
ncbi:hypothetical protein CALVIDRAFT_564233 [Calocera viscosa TUFC12733]|uniref:Uncharacterized protein n=1 Tax=Calocera viscosa (strain TUFC12733) TaxID=1330018 RepID=A0A167LRC1_CALVF|nr:hypothetical protein CALVIDRAFT_564233 [Calocera viscosa TUFC12733]